MFLKPASSIHVFLMIMSAFAWLACPAMRRIVALPAEAYVGYQPPTSRFWGLGGIPGPPLGANLGEQESRHHQRDIYQRCQGKDGGKATSAAKVLRSHRGALADDRLRPMIAVTLFLRAVLH